MDEHIKQNLETKEPGELLMEVAKAGDVIQVGKLLETGRYENDKIDYVGKALYAAIISKQKEVAELLIAFGAEPEFGLYAAAGNGWLDMTKQLIAKGASVNPASGLPLTWAIKSGNIELVKYLISQGADINIQNSRPLIFAIESRNKAMVKLLLDSGANVNPNIGVSLLDIVYMTHDKQLIEMFESAGTKSSVPA